MATDPDLDIYTKMTLSDIRASLTNLKDALRDTRGGLAEVTTGFIDLQSALKAGFIDLQSVLSESRADTRGDLRSLQDEIREVGAKLDRLLFLLLAGLIAIVVALLTRKLG